LLSKKNTKKHRPKHRDLASKTKATDRPSFFFFFWGGAPLAPHFRCSRCLLPAPGAALYWIQLHLVRQKKKGKKNKDSKKNVSSNVRIDGFENTDANL
jgi:hypothetical protein